MHPGNPMEESPSPASPPAPATAKRALAMPSEGAVIAGALSFIALLTLHLALTRTLNWDEFHFYRQILEYQRGEPLAVFQTLHVTVFGWLPAWAPSGVDAILIARLFMLACAFATATAIACIAERFANRNLALVAALVWLASGFTLQHGWAFRTDPIATALVTSALAIVLRARLSLGWIALAGALVGTAGVVTVKAILFAPAFAGIAILRWSEEKFTLASALRIAVVPVVALATLAALIAWHSSHLAAEPTSGPGGFVSSSSQAMLFSGWPVYWIHIPRWALLSIPAFAALCVALTQLAKRPWAEALALAGLIAPLFALIVYRNTLPYFYPTMLAPVAAASVVGIAPIAKRYGLRVFAICTALLGGAVWMIEPSSRIEQQRELQAAADVIFPEPVGYIDFPGLLPNHNKANTFLSRVGVDNLYARGPGQFRALLENKSVPLLLTAEPEPNPTLLAIMNEWPQAARFHHEEQEVLRATYRPFWGPFWLAGRVVPAGETARYEVLVPGDYTVTGGKLVVNGETLNPGEALVLERGFVELANTSSIEAGIVWGDNLKAPDKPAPARPYWRGF